MVHRAIEVSQTSTSVYVANFYSVLVRRSAFTPLISFGTLNQIVRYVDYLAPQSILSIEKKLWRQQYGTEIPGSPTSDGLMSSRHALYWLVSSADIRSHDNKDYQHGIKELPVNKE